MQTLRVVVLVSVAVLVAGCATAGPTAPAGQTATTRQDSSPPAERVLTMSIAVEPTYIAAQAPLPPGGASGHNLYRHAVRLVQVRIL